MQSIDSPEDSLRLQPLHSSQRGLLTHFCNSWSQHHGGEGNCFGNQSKESTNERI